MTTSGTAGPDPAADPDTKDWTWVLDRPCPACGFDAGAVFPSAVPGLLRHDAQDWAARLSHDLATTRPAPDVWSVLEYGCHVRDVHRIFAHRVRLMLAEDEPRFPNWDQDETAITDRYSVQQPMTVAVELRAAAGEVADLYETVPDGSWSRRGIRSNGSEFTISSIALYHLHDIVHHAWDVAAERR